jgi:glucose/arabinose dehydrogenase
VNENTGLATVVVSRGLATGVASVNYTTVAGTALTNSDFQATSGTLNFASGESSKTIMIPIINDAIGEANETFTLRFSNSVGVGLNLQNSTEITIIDDDPGSFVREAVVSGLAAPTTFDWIPGSTNRLLIAQKNGVVRMSENGTLLTTPFIDISDQVNNTRDRGLLGMAIHPDFSKSGADKKPYVYLLFTYDPPETKLNLNPNTILDAPDQPGNRPSRLIRVEADPATNYTTAKPGSEVVLLGKNSNWANTSRPDGNSTSMILNSDGSINYVANFAPSGIVNSSGQLFANMQDYYNNLSHLTNIEDYLATDSESHSVGDLEFGTDGSLFISIGDGTSYNEVDPRAIRVQDLNNLSGKILRIDPITGAGLADNPFYDASKPNSNKSKVYDYGLRNPFRFSINEATNIPYIGDVGWKTWEEVNAGKAKNFGWPYFEGGNGVSIQQPEYDNLAPAQQFYASGQQVTAPIYAFQHAGADAIVMGDFYTGNTFPSIYKNTLFIANYSKGTVDNITLDSQGQFVSIRRFDTFSNPRANAPVQITMGQDGNLYYADIAAGAISRWRPV